MRITKTAAAILLSVLMLLSCMPSGYANPAEEPAAPQKQAAQPEDIEDIKDEAVLAETQKGDVYYDPIHVITLTEAANPYNAIEPIPISSSSTWGTQRDYDSERVVASAIIPSASGTYSKVLATETFSLKLSDSFMSWRANVSTDEGASLTVRCTNTSSGAVWYPYAYTFMDDTWFTYSCPLTSNAPNIDVGEYYNVKVEFIYSFTVSSKGGDEPEGPSCMLTDLRIVDYSSYDGALNAPDSDLHFVPAADNDFDPDCSYAYPYASRSFVRFEGVSGADAVSALTAHVVAAAGDVLSFEYVSELNYMQGAVFSFGIGTSVDDMQVLYSGEEEGGDGSLWFDWASWSYTIPANGEYDFIWALETWDSDDSFVYLDNVRITPRMSKERVLYEASCPTDEAVYSDGDDTPWYPVYFKNTFSLRSGKITHNGTSTFMSEHNLFKAGDWYQFRFWMSSEKNYDLLNVYLINETTGEVRDDFSESGISTGWVAAGGVIEEDGIYTLKFVYQKDYSVSSGDDCAYIDFVTIPAMTNTHAAAYDDETEDDLHAYDYYPEVQYRFVPALYNGEVVLVSNNKGVHSSFATVYFTAELEANEIFTFDYIRDAETNYDNLTVTVNEQSTVIKQRSTDWQRYSYKAPSAGTYEFEVTFRKDSSVHVGTDTVYLRNVRIGAEDSLFNEAIQLDYSGDDYLFQYEGGGFEIVNTEGGAAVAYTSANGENSVAIGARHAGIAFDYVTFKYKVVGDASAQFIVANHEYSTQDLDYTAEGDWQDFYYRIPQSYDDWLFVINASSNGGTVYIDDFYIGTLSMFPLEDALDETGADPVNIDYANTSGFEGVYDPLEPHGQTEFIRSRAGFGETASVKWDVYLEPGDRLLMTFCLFQEFDYDCTSRFQIYMDDELQMDAAAEWMHYDTWYYTQMEVDYCGWYSFEIRYLSEALNPGDAFAVGTLGVYRSCSLDEALNVEGGTIHFYEYEGTGNFVPRVSGDLSYGAPKAAYYPEDYASYSCDFEDADSLEGWSLFDNDGDGYNWRRYNAYESDTHLHPKGGEYVLCSDDYAILPGAQEIALYPDDWAVTPAMTINSDDEAFYVEFMYAPSAPLYQGEKFGVYVGNGNSVNTYRKLGDITLSSSGWTWGSFLVDRSYFTGNTVRVAFRHYGVSDVTGVMLDYLYMRSTVRDYAQVSFDLNVSAGDEIAFDLYCNGRQADLFEGVEFILEAEGHGELYHVDSAEFGAEYGMNEWVHCSVTVPFSGNVTFRFIERSAYEDLSILNMLIDNVEFIHNENGLIGDVNCDGEVSFLDVSALSLFLTGEGDLTEQGLANADFDGDGTVSFLDITALYLFLSGE